MWRMEHPDVPERIITAIEPMVIPADDLAQPVSERKSQAIASE
jgi:hypothetical protein